VIHQQTNWQVLGLVTQCCSAPVLILDRPRDQWIEVFCAGCLDDVVMIVPLHRLQRAPHVASWPWMSARRAAA